MKADIERKRKSTRGKHTTASIPLLNSSSNEQPSLATRAARHRYRLHVLQVLVPLQVVELHHLVVLVLSPDPLLAAINRRRSAVRLLRILRPALTLSMLSMVAAL